MKLQYKLATGLFIVTLLPLASLIIGIYIFNQSQIGSIADVSQWQVQSVLKGVDTGLEHAQTEIMPWALSSNLTDAATTARQKPREELENQWKTERYLYNPTAEYLKRINSLGGNQYQEIFLTDERGYVVASTNPTSDFGQGPEDDPPGGEPWWAEARTKGKHVGELEFDESVGAFSLDISLALHKEGRFVGVLKAVYDVESILDVVGHSDIGRSGHAVLVNRDGNIIAAPNRFRSIVFNKNTNIANLEIFSLIANNRSGFTMEHVPWVGKAFISTAPTSEHGNIRDRGWNALVIMPMEEALVPVREVQKISMVSLLVILLALSLFTLSISRRLAKPLADIASSVSQIDGGNLNVTVPHQKNNDEVGRLAVSINRMTERLHEYDELNIERIQALNSELEKANQELQDLASRDGLTGLWNARIFHDRLEQEIKRCQRTGNKVSLLLIDVDHFKSVNDTYGHQAGDEVLRRLGTILQDASRETDIPARYGGEELAIILTDTDQLGAIKVAEKVRKLIAVEECDTESGTITITASIGVSEYRAVEGVANPKDHMVKLADEALYRAKKGGRNRVEAADLEEKEEKGSE